MSDTSSSNVMEVKCPTCGKSVQWLPSSSWRPFCSERCKLIDLGEWASESHRIAGSTADFNDDDQF
ncbi:DNA gyrase inhibitor YacG [Parathalassolituus penaei]|uniref:DNA gyrase inhibitor YacG n=1 Tax=Parathalassolituus penaei TaxID=2997323 RepID=A0A9X3IRI5_9GAMM|nr:DNA gyrase inhibitor YacG [Parathalassolituus penaei]MCY0964280.1 DNA gyrase inhibitor YacG [Parathalassolituus penaei]